VLTYGEIESDAEALAAAFSNLEIETGDRSALLSPPFPEAASTFAVARTNDVADKRRFIVGRPLAGTESGITEADGEESPVESVGEIGGKAPGVMIDYYRQPK